ncbi:MAG: hypothetical protein HOD92_24580 [Deltaproteobacteria bacterium]|jgi:hypothetical protein|nr:hypothetical protein [Deltaproteobacteria bacterium]
MAIITISRGTYSKGKEKYITLIPHAFLQHLQNGNIVYHGLGGHFFLQKISHVLKVRITCNMENRIREEMKRENISKSKARQPQ